jgi:antitoxin PrlF
MPMDKITSSAHTTVPHEVREALAAKPGDLLEWELKPDGSVEVRRVASMDTAYLNALDATLSEWESKEDEEAYVDL